MRVATVVTDEHTLVKAIVKYAKEELGLDLEQDNRWICRRSDYIHDVYVFGLPDDEV